MPNPLWIWWMFELFLYFIADMSPYILFGIFLAWVAKIRLSQRHRQYVIEYRFREWVIHKDPPFTCLNILDDLRRYESYQQNSASLEERQNP